MTTRSLPTAQPSLSAQALAKAWCQGQYPHTATPATWHAAFAYLAVLPHDTVFDKPAIAACWRQFGGDIRAKLRDDRLLLQVLRRALPGYQGAGCTLYRGESWFLLDADQIGVCWTTSEAQARRYASGLNAVDSGGVLLRAYAPASAILSAPGPADGDVWLCDPRQLLRLTTLDWFAKP